MDIVAAVVREPNGIFAIEKLQLDSPRDHEILVRIVGAGLCHTDLSCRDQMYPVPLSRDVWYTLLADCCRSAGGL